MNNNWIITIGRQFCSGGAEIGQKVAEHFGIPYYDKSIIDHTAEILKIEASLVEKHDERPSSIWDAPGYQYSSLWYHSDPALTLPLSLKVAETQFHTIREYAKQGSCVIVGRCADHVLRNNKSAISVFIRADIEKRTERAKRLYKLSENDAKKLIKKTDRIRANYYSSHTHDEWGVSENYDLILDSSILGIDTCVSVIIKTIEELDEKKNRIIGL